MKGSFLAAIALASLASAGPLAVEYRGRRVVDREPGPRPEPLATPATEPTRFDGERLARAEAKRARKAAKASPPITTGN